MLAKIKYLKYSVNPKSHRLNLNLNVICSQRYYSEQIKKDDSQRENLQNGNPSEAIKLEKPIIEPVEPVEPVVPQIQEEVLVVTEEVVPKKEEAVLLDSKIDQEFRSDKEQANIKTKRNKFIFWGIGIALALFSSGLYYYAMAISEDVIQKLWVPLTEFDSLSDDQILIRIENFGEKIDFPTLRDIIFEQEWPVQMLIQCLKHKEPLIRESALHVLTKMSDYENFRGLIGKRVNFAGVMNEAIKRPGLSKDDYPFHTFLAQYMDQPNVQKLALSSNGRYFFTLTNMLTSPDNFPRGVAIIALSKLAANNEANKLMASYGVFPLVMNYFNPYDPEMTLSNDGTYFKFQVREKAFRLLEQLYRGPYKDLAIQQFDEPVARSMGRTLDEYERTVTEPFMYSEHIFKTMIGGLVIGGVWGYLRHFIRHRNLKTAFTKGSTRASIGTFIFILAAQLIRLASDRIPNPSDHTQAFAGSLRMVACYASFFVSKRFFPFCFLPSFVMLISSEWPAPSQLWSYREINYPAMTPEEYHRQLEEQRARQQEIDAQKS
jgi:hypothetical protein